MNRRDFLHLGALASAGALGCFLLPGCASEPEKPQVDASQVLLHYKSEDGLNKATFFAFDTVVTIQADGDAGALDAVQERCAYYEGLFSRTVAGSDIDRVNNAQGQPVEVAPETAELVAAALGYCEASGGLFDITIGTVTDLWDFDEGIVPDADALAEAVSHVDWRAVSVEGQTVRVADPAAKLDLGGVAKGWIADALADMLREAGCKSALINLGGNVYALGARPDGSDWNVGMRDPNNPDGPTFGAVEMRDASIVTSGLYERNFTKDGVFYYHIIDPATGYPASTDLLASTIRSARSVDCDAYSTIMFLQGSAAALRTLRDHDGFEGLLFTDGDEVLTSEGFAWTEL